jgi:hypothetical protein
MSRQQNVQRKIELRVKELLKNNELLRLALAFGVPLLTFLATIIFGPGALFVLLGIIMTVFLGTILNFGLSEWSNDDN